MQKIGSVVPVTLSQCHLHAVAELTCDSGDSGILGRKDETDAKILLVFVAELRNYLFSEPA